MRQAGRQAEKGSSQGFYSFLCFYVFTFPRAWVQIAIQVASAFEALCIRFNVRCPRQLFDGSERREASHGPLKCEGSCWSDFSNFCGLLWLPEKPVCWGQPTKPERWERPDRKARGGVWGETRRAQCRVGTFGNGAAGSRKMFVCV